MGWRDSEQALPYCHLGRVGGTRTKYLGYYYRCASTCIIFLLCLLMVAFVLGEGGMMQMVVSLAVVVAVYNTLSWWLYNIVCAAPN